jgi:hypothetical protein
LRIARCPRDWLERVTSIIDTCEDQLDRFGRSTYALAVQYPE